MHLQTARVLEDYRQQSQFAPWYSGQSFFPCILGCIQETNHLFDICLLFDIMKIFCICKGICYLANIVFSICLAVTQCVVTLS